MNETSQFKPPPTKPKNTIWVLAAVGVALLSISADLFYFRKSLLAAGITLIAGLVLLTTAFRWSMSPPR